MPHRVGYDVPDNRVGLELEALYGDFDRGPLTPASREYVFVVRR